MATFKVAMVAVALAPRAMTPLLALLLRLYFGQRFSSLAVILAHPGFELLELLVLLRLARLAPLAHGPGSGSVGPRT